jgi:hypothetical protein
MRKRKMGISKNQNAGAYLDTRHQTRSPTPRHHHLFKLPFPHPLFLPLAPEFLTLKLPPHFSLPIIRQRARKSK